MNLKNKKLTEYTAPPFISHRTKKSAYDIAHNFVSTIKERVKAAIPQEPKLDSMIPPKKHVVIVWRPHNYRRQIEIKERSDSTLKKVESAIGVSAAKNKLLFVKNYEGSNVTIMYGRRSLTGIYRGLFYYKITRDNLDDLETAVFEKRKDIAARIDSVISKFSALFKIGVPAARPKWSRYEDFIKGESYIDSLPQDLIIHDTIFKKVYGEGIEFKSSIEHKAPVVHMKNYIKNRAIEDISPQIATELGVITAAMTDLNARFVPAIESLSANLVTHVSVMKDIGTGLRNFNGTVTELKIGITNSAGVTLDLKQAVLDLVKIIHSEKSRGVLKWILNRAKGTKKKVIL